MKNLVFSHNDNLVTDSLLVADKFSKRHDNIIRAIEKLELDSNFTELNFELSNYQDSTGRTLKKYIITRDGFTLLVMGFTGKNAMQFKVDYIEEFNRMSEELKQKDYLNDPFIQLRVNQLKQDALIKENALRIEAIEHDRQMIKAKTNTLRLAKQGYQKKFKNEIRQLVNHYVELTELTHRQAWNKIYSELFHHFGISITPIQKHINKVTKKSHSKLEVCEIRGFLGEIHIIISDLIKQAK